MKKQILFILVFFCSLFAFSDTTDYVQVFLNDQLISQFNPNNEYQNINIEDSKLKETDQISIKYKDLPVVKGNVYYFTCIKILNMQEQAPQKLLKITLI